MMKTAQTTTKILVQKFEPRKLASCVKIPSWKVRLLSKIPVFLKIHFVSMCMFCAHASTLELGGRKRMLTLELELQTVVIQSIRILILKFCKRNMTLND